MKTRLLFLLTILFSFSISAQIDFEAHIIVDSHPDVVRPFALISTDIDADGDKDLFATTTSGDKVMWFKNLDGQGNFSEPIIISSNMDYPMGLAIADIDGDEDLDLVAISNNDHKIAWFENTDGLGTFGNLKLAGTFTWVQTVEAKDMDGDGDIDIIAGGNDKISWLENLDGLGTFAPEKVITTLSYTESIKVSDIDGDGDMDVTAADWTKDKVTWYKNIDGQGTFGPENIISNETYGTNSVATKDMDNDGDLDVISPFGFDGLAWFENKTGIGDFGDPNIIFPNLGFVYKLFVEDLDGDGNKDILASLYDDGKIAWIGNDGFGNFREPQIFFSDGNRPISVIADDFNGDGKIDVAACIYGSNQIIWFENKGSLVVEENTANLFSIYPNPTNGVLNIKSKSIISEVNIYNKIGQLLFTSEKTNQLEISALSKGIYFVKISDENGQTETKRVIKR